MAEISQNLERYRRESGNCHTAARDMRVAAQSLDDRNAQHFDEAAEAERLAIVAEEEAAR